MKTRDQLIDIAKAACDAIGDLSVTEVNVVCRMVQAFQLPADPSAPAPSSTPVQASTSAASTTVSAEASTKASS